MRPYAPGDRVSQSQYGAGTITSVDEHHTVIDFDEHGTRRFSTPLVKLERSTTVAPERATPARRKAAPRKSKS